MSLLPSSRRFVPSRYADRYSTADGSVPPFADPGDVFPEDLEAAALVAEYINRGELLLTRLTWSQRAFKSHQYYSALVQEQFEAAKLARRTRENGAPLIAALKRIANGVVAPSLDHRRRRLAEIADCAGAGRVVPPFSYKL